jgi:predicted unusual protein kinase regulating ubiquinone biosynthesis (AarF/ABC1/UbiB family)
MDLLRRRAAVAGTLAELPARVLLARGDPGRLGAWLAARAVHLGPAFVKAGQFVSARRDLFGDGFSAPFAVLRDRVRAEPAAAMLRTPSLGRLLAARELRDFEPEPLATASVGQVHGARLRDGRRVVLKIRRPGVRQAVADDVSLLRALLAGAAATGAREEDAARLRDGLRDLEAGLAHELDFRREAAAMQRFRVQRRRLGLRVRVPRVHAHLCSADLLVMERVDSVRLGQTGGGGGAALAGDLMELYVRQVARGGVVHGDPHPGNLGLDADGRLVLYDFGSVVELSRRERARLRALVWALVVDDPEAAARGLTRLGARVLSVPGLAASIRPYREYLRTLDVARLREAAGAAGRQPPVVLPDKLLRLTRTFGALEGVCKDLDPGFNYVQFAMSPAGAAAAAELLLPE